MSSRRLRPVARAEVHAVILDILPGLSAADIDDSAHLKDLGADSVDRVEIIMGVLDRLHLQEPLSTFSEVPNIGALIQLLSELKARRA